MWKAVIFIDSDFVPVGDRESARWKGISQEQRRYPFWRMYIVVREIANGKLIDAWLGDSARGWVRCGPALRGIAADVMYSTGTALLYDYSVRKELDLYQNDVPGVRKWSAPKMGTLGSAKFYQPEPAATGDVFRTVPIAMFPQQEWPNQSCWSSTAIFYNTSKKSSRAVSDFARKLDRGEFGDCENTMFAPRFDPDRLTNLLAVADIYLFAFCFSQPETSDPMFICTKRLNMNACVKTATQRLASEGIEVYISRTIQAYSAWQTEGVLPIDAVRCRS